MNFPISNLEKMCHIFLEPDLFDINSNNIIVYKIILRWDISKVVRQYTSPYQKSIYSFSAPLYLLYSYIPHYESMYYLPKNVQTFQFKQHAFHRKYQLLANNCQYIDPDISSIYHDMTILWFHQSSDWNPKIKYRIHLFILIFMSIHF